jgi:hypothetical protein
VTEYKGKFFSVLGDSISTLDGYSTPADAVFYNRDVCLRSDVYAPSDTWWGQVIERLGGSILINNSISGSMVSKHPLCEIPSYGCSSLRTASLGNGDITPDVIMIFMGINDWGAGVPIFRDEGSGDGDLSVFSVAYSVMLKSIKDSYPTAEIWCLTLPVSTCSRVQDFRFPYCYGRRHIEEYSAAIRDCAEVYGARLIELYHPDLPHDTIDGFHPDAGGMHRLAENVISAVVAIH